MKEARNGVNDIWQKSKLPKRYKLKGKKGTGNIESGERIIQRHNKRYGIDFMRRRRELVRVVKVDELHEIDEIDRAKMRGVAILLTKIARRLLAEKKAKAQESGVSERVVN